MGSQVCGIFSNGVHEITMLDCPLKCHLLGFIGIICSQVHFEEQPLETFVYFQVRLHDITC